MSTRRAHLEIGGMSCSTCAATNEDATGSVPGVIRVSVNAATDVVPFADGVPVDRDPDDDGPTAPDGGRGVAPDDEPTAPDGGVAVSPEPVGDVDPEPAEATMTRLEAERKTAMLVACEGELCGVIATADTVHESARETVTALRDRGITVSMLTGDNERTARAVAEQVGIDPESVRAEVRPEDKADAIEVIQADGSRAVMVGDGVNDAPALTTAHVGIAIGSGTDVAIESADVTLMRDDPRDVLKALRISEATISKVRQNLFWAFVYNTTLIPIASLGPLNPALAGLAMAGSPVSVMTNSLAFSRWDPKTDYHLLVTRPFHRLFG